MKNVDLAKAYRLLYPAVPVVVVAAFDGKISAMPVVSIISLSNRPALVGFSSSRSHDTYGTVAKSGRFSVSWLGEEYREAVEKMGTTSGTKSRDKLALSGLRHVEAGTPSVPVVAEAAAFMVCDVTEERSYGDHVLVVGKVEEAIASDEFDEYWPFRQYRPIVYAGIGGPRLTLS